MRLVGCVECIVPEPTWHIYMSRYAQILHAFENVLTASSHHIGYRKSPLRGFSASWHRSAFGLVCYAPVVEWLEVCAKSISVLTTTTLSRTLSHPGLPKACVPTASVRRKVPRVNLRTLDHVKRSLITIHIQVERVLAADPITANQWFPEIRA